MPRMPICPTSLKRGHGNRGSDRAGAAVDYLSGLMNNIYAYEAELTGYLFEQLQQIPGIRTYGPQPKVAGLGRAALAAFTAGMFTLDLSTILDLGFYPHHCTSHCTPRYLVAQCTGQVCLSTTPVKKLMCSLQL